MASEVRKTLARVSTNYARLLTTLALGVVEVSVLLAWMGKDAFGLVSLLGPTIGLAAILREIINQSMIRELGAAYHSNDPDRFARTYRACYAISVRACILCAFLFAGLAWALPHVLRIPPELVDAGRIFALATGFESCLMILVAPTFNMYVVRERFTFQNAWLAAKRACFSLAAIGLWIAMPDIPPAQAVAIYGIVANIATAFLTLLPVVLVWKRDRSLLPSTSARDRGAMREILGTFGWNSAVTFALSVADSTPQLFTNWFFGVSGNAVYGIAWRLGAYARMITVGSTFGLEAVSTRLSSASDGADRIRTFISQSTRLHSWVAFPAGLAIAILAEPLLRMWVGRSLQSPETVIPVAVPVTQVVVLAMTCRGISEGWIRILYGDGHVRRYAPLVIAACIAMPLITWLGVVMLPPPLDFNAPAISYSLVTIVAFLVLLPLWGAVILRVRARLFAMPMARTALVTFLSAPVLLVPYELGMISNPLRVAMAAAGFGMVYFALSFLIVINRNERRRLLNAIRRLGSRPPRPADDRTGAPPA